MFAASIGLLWLQRIILSFAKVASSAIDSRTIYDVNSNGIMFAAIA